MNRKISDIPEGGCHVSELHKYKVVDAPDEKLGEGVTREWAIRYRDIGSHDVDLFIVHALTKEAAFDHFVSLYPNTQVLSLEYLGIYF